LTKFVKAPTNILRYQISTIEFAMKSIFIVYLFYAINVETFLYKLSEIQDSWTFDKTRMTFFLVGTEECLLNY